MKKALKQLSAQLDEVISKLVAGSAVPRCLLSTTRSVAHGQTFVLSPVRALSEFQRQGEQKTRLARAYDKEISEVRSVLTHNIQDSLNSVIA
jgi:hypothetical protein